MSNTLLLQNLRYYNILPGGLQISMYDEDGNLAPEIHAVYENNTVLVFYAEGYILLDIEGDVLEENTHENLEHSADEALKDLNHEVVKALHTMTYAMTKQYTDCKHATIQMIIQGLKNAYPKEDVSTEVNLLTYLSFFHDKLNALGGDINPYDVKLQRLRL